MKIIQVGLLTPTAQCPACET